MICARRVVGHVIDIRQTPAVERQGRDGIRIGVADGKRPVAPGDARARDGVRTVREPQCVAQQPAVAADLVERGLGRLPRRARIPERRHRLRVRDRVGRVHVHGRESCVRELRHRLRDLRVREIDARTRAVADRLHHGLIPLRRRDGGVCRSFGLCRRLLPAGRQQQRRCAQQAAKNSFHARTSRHFLQTVYTKKFGIANFAASAILSEMDAVRCRRESAAAAEGVTLSGKRTGG